MGALHIPIHKWPLPDDKLDVLNVIFELRALPVFCIWRDTTYGLLHDICTPRALQPSATVMYETLDTYAQLLPYSDWESGRHRISLASSTKSFEALQRYQPHSQSGYLMSAKWSAIPPL